MRFVGNNAYLLPDCGEFYVCCGLATVYRKDIDFSLDIEDNSYWLCRPDQIYYEDNVDSYGGKCTERYSFYYKMDHYEKYCKEIEEIRLGRIACRDRILNTPSLYEEVMQELDKRREHSVEKLKSFGVEI